ncbi:hypothetical protein FBZ84_101125 [Azospirillum baldaniorum]|uniref:hypothetical protein n=1 Tax=Azospirillum baldaniorum TaxID=1064539 RepID=UPI0011AAFA9D|nr:hypothetical protein [Azospirillum baldaniorum]TWA71859.1 hypothetical protein FBZ84_101125 [Azospirillum baldaniorum]
MSKTTHIAITLCVYDGCPGGLEGFAEVARFPAREEARIREMATSERTQWLADFWDKDGHYDDVCLTDDAVSALIGKPVAELVSAGRQKLAQIDDEAAEWLARRHPYAFPATPSA